MADSRIKSASEILSAFFDRDLVKQGEYYALFDKSWKSIAGPRLAPHSRPVDIHHGLLIVETEHQGWMQLLQFQQDKMLGEIQRRFPDLGVRAMAFRLNEPKAVDGLDLSQVSGVPKKTSGLEAQPKRVPESRPLGENKSVEEKKELPSSALPAEIRGLFEKIRKNIEQ